VNAQDIFGRTVLMYSLYSRTAPGGIEVIRLLLGYGANVNRKSKYRETALMFAVESGHTDVAQLLREAGATE